MTYKVPIRRDIWLFAGVPVDGVAGTFVGQAIPGDSLVDTVNKVRYLNTGTQASPTWTLEAATAASALDGTVAKNGANDDVIGALTVLFRIAIAAGALATKNVLMTHKIRVVDAWLVLTGAGVANTTFAVGNAGTAITDEMLGSGTDKALVRAATIDDAQHEVAAGANLSVKSSTGATQPNAIVYVLAERVA
jgi:hypothetical protein